MKAQFPSLESLEFDRGVMNRAISKGGGIVLDDLYGIEHNWPISTSSKGSLSL
jgi:hypothetical protein